MNPYRILVTGGLGLIGSHLCETLQARGIPVCAVDNRWFNGVPLTAEAQQEVTRRHRLLDDFVEADVADAEAFDAVVRRFQPTHVAHLASLSRADVARRAPIEAARHILAPTLQVLDSLERLAPDTRLLYVSSSMVYGHFLSPEATETHPCHPIEFYGAGKLACEQLVHAWAMRGHEAVIVRPSAVYGPGDFNARVTGLFVERALEKQPLILNNNGEERLDFTYVDDLVEGLCAALLAPEANGETFNLTFGAARSLNDLAAAIRKWLPCEIERRAETGRRPRRGTLSIDKARVMLGFSPHITLENGIAKVLAARGLCTVSDTAGPERPIAQSRPLIGEAETDAVLGALQSPWLSGGPENRRFEDACARFLGVDTLAVNSGFSALILALMAAGIRGEVLVPAYTFPAVANAVILAGAIPVFVDVETTTFGLCPQAAAHAIGPHTEAILAPHAGGSPCQAAALRALADQHGLLLIEDVAQAMGATLGGKQAGTFGHFGCFSFFPTKTMTTGEGGLFATRDEAWMARARALIAHGIGAAPRRYPWQRRLETVGFNFRLSAPQAALGSAQLARLPAMLATRRRLAALYREALSGSELRLQGALPHAEPAYQLFLVRIPDGVSRDDVVMELRRQGIEASVHYDLPVPQEAPYTCHESFPVAEELCRTLVSLPMHPLLTGRDIARIARAVQGALTLEVAR